MSSDTGTGQPTYIRDIYMSTFVMPSGGMLAGQLDIERSPESLGARYVLLKLAGETVRGDDFLVRLREAEGKFRDALIHKNVHRLQAERQAHEAVITWAKVLLADHSDILVYVLFELDHKVQVISG